MPNDTPLNRTTRYEPDVEAPTSNLPRVETPQSIGRYAIERLLGTGGFGLVYLANDGQLSRLVALKVPHSRLISGREGTEEYLNEARVVASLDHPHIVPVYDVGSTAECPCFVVSKYIEGGDLKARLKRIRSTPVEAATLVATLADALHYAHTEGLVHRDVKPANILLDKSGKPFITDFGIALREQDPSDVYRYAGTPAYMSPEQSRGEGHRLDGRSDIFSLGVILYEMLVGCRPFRGQGREELLELIATAEPRPPRQIDDTISRELERICLKALAKRAAERYTTASDLADDLRHYLATATASTLETALHTPVELASGASDAKASVNWHASSSLSHSPPLRIVPKGLRSFDRSDAEFFLELLPGPRDREGLPESLRFWKSRIEASGGEQPFSVGLIYGPSGCGKSSLVKAGLLPRLSSDVVSVYLEATEHETESRLLYSLRRHCPELNEHKQLKETLFALRRGQGVPAGKKLLIVIDQFEQWLHGRHPSGKSDLVQALRQCDGTRLQCIVMVRDDFWMAVTRFLEELEVELVQGKNFAAADLFDSRHAARVLTAFGQAFGDLPEEAGDITSQQRDFVRQAVEGLTQDGKVICVRLAVFAEMMKGKPWTPASLKKLGGEAGVGVTFLEETFSARTASPKYRIHQTAARAVLKALLPLSGADIKGHMRTYGELLESSGYAGRAAAFDELIRILDAELRMITPIDSEGFVAESLDTDPGDAPSQGPAELRDRGCYQLTHDYLVPALRRWLTQKQRETRRGRAELLLADRARLWNERREKNQLPSWWEYASIHAFTRQIQWNETERDLMDAADRHYLFRCSIAIGALVLMIWSVFEIRGRMKTDALVTALTKAESSEVPAILHELPPLRPWAAPYLRAEQPATFKEELHRGVALLRLEQQPDDARRMVELVPQTSAEQAQLVAREMQGSYEVVRESLWGQLRSAEAPQSALAAATVIAACDPHDSGWDDVAQGIAEQMVLLPERDAGLWLNNLLPIGSRLVPHLEGMFTRLTREEVEDSQRTYVAALGLERYLRDDPALLSKLLVEHARHGPELHCLIRPLTARDLFEVRRLGDDYVKQRNGLGPEADGKPVAEGLPLAHRIGNAALVEWLLGDASTLRDRLRSGADRTIRSTIIHQVSQLSMPPDRVLALLEAETEADVRAALLLSLGGISRLVVPDKLAARLESQLPKLANDSDPETHSAAQWVATRWGLAEGERRPVERAPGTAGWYVTSEGQTMVRVRGCLDHEFALSSTEITVAEFRRFDSQHETQQGSQYKDFLDVEQLDQCPVIAVNVFDAMDYCNWLSRRDGIDESQWCYEGLARESLRPKPSHMKLRGYRLPDFPEWKCGCRAGARTPFSIGNGLGLLSQYAWYFSNARIAGQHRARPVATTKPNALGLFDTYGNVWEWVAIVDHPTRGRICGGSCDNDPVDLESIDKEVMRSPMDREIRIGFRIAQTVQPQP